MRRAKLDISYLEFVHELGLYGRGSDALVTRMVLDRSSVLVVHCEQVANFILAAG
jgi:hypothetical protein